MAEGMRVETLSDHVGDLLRSAHDVSLHGADGIDDLWLRHDEMEGAVRAAAETKSWWRRALVIESPAEARAARQLERLRLELRSAQRGREGHVDEVNRIEAGIRGEQALVDALAEALNDDWTCFRGYVNERGEADVLLVGPRGIWVVEVKNRRVHLTVDDEGWMYRQIDSRGNVSASRPATDRTGRSWGHQASDVAEALDSWLERHGSPSIVRSAVVIVHRGARIDSFRDPGVDCLTTYVSDLLRAIRRPPPTMTSESLWTMAELIRHHHRHVRGPSEDRADVGR